MKFKYSEYIGPNNLKLYRPTVPIYLRHNSKLFQFEAIIDSGADYSILPL